MNEKIINRSLPVPLTRDEKVSYGRRLAQMQETYENTEVEKKSAAEDFKDRLEKLESRMSFLAKVIRDGEEYRDVECQWRYIFEPNTKELVRMDTAEIVETKAITAEECQLLLQLNQDGEAAKAASAGNPN